MLSDDASSDGSVALAEGLIEEHRAADAPTPSLVVLRNPTALGVTANFEQALRAASGDLVVLADQDDVWRPDRIARALREFTARPEVELVASDARLVDGSGAALGSTLFDTLGVDAALLGRFRSDGSFDELLRRNVVTGATMAIARRLVEARRSVPRVVGARRVARDGRSGRRRAQPHRRTAHRLPPARRQPDRSAPARRRREAREAARAAHGPERAVARARHGSRRATLRHRRDGQGSRRRSRRSLRTSGRAPLSPPRVCGASAHCGVSGGQAVTTATGLGCRTSCETSCNPSDCDRSTVAIAPDSAERTD